MADDRQNVRGWWIIGIIAIIVILWLAWGGYNGSTQGRNGVPQNAAPNTAGTAPAASPRTNPGVR